MYVLTVGEDVAADALMRQLKERGVEVELRQDRKSTVGPGLLDILTGTYVRILVVMCVVCYIISVGS